MQARKVAFAMKNVELVVRMLEQVGVRWVFGVPSGPVLPLIEALRESSVAFVLTASETSAGFMASTVGYLSGVPGVCVSTVGPGATNLTTGVGSAWLDRAPALAITCNVASPWLERRIQMRIDHNALFKPLTKATLSLRDGRVGESLAKALALATEEPPGPVHLDLPEDIAVAQGSESAGAAQVTGKLPDPSSTMIETISAALETSRRPLLIIGLSFTRSKAPERLLQFIEKQGMPFVTTLHGKGFLPETHPLCAGVLGRARRTDVQRFVDGADLVLALGYDPIEINYEEWAGKKPLVHISTERAETGNTLNWVLNEACDIDGAVGALGGLQTFANDWNGEELQGHRENLERSLRPPATGFSPHEALDILRKRLPKDGILAYDVGAHTHQIASQWHTDVAKTLLATNGWSSMGYGMPAAFAAKLVFPERNVVCVVGDGGFQMTVGELALARRLNLAVPTIVLNDGWLGLMKVKQERKNYRLSGVRLGEPPPSPPHYFGVACRPAKTAREFRDALQWAFAQNGPSVVEAFVDVASYSETVFD
jgi:acetolactate synthase I/II/III large subunit